MAYKQAQKDFENAQKQVTALEEEAVKALTGESQLDLSIVNQMLLKHRAKLEPLRKQGRNAARMQAERKTHKPPKPRWMSCFLAECFEKAELRHQAT